MLNTTKLELKDLLQIIPSHILIKLILGILHIRCICIPTDYGVTIIKLNTFMQHPYYQYSIFTFYQYILNLPSAVSISEY